jgi:hypothetical protein
MGNVGGYGFHQPEPQRAQHPLTVPVVFGPERRAQFNYRIITTGRGQAARLDEDRLNALGRDGWLLVSVLPRSDGEGGSNLDYLFVRSEP